MIYSALWAIVAPRVGQAISRDSSRVDNSQTPKHGTASCGAAEDLANLEREK